MPRRGSDPRIAAQPRSRAAGCGAAMFGRGANVRAANYLGHTEVVTLIEERLASLALSWDFKEMRGYVPTGTVWMGGYDY
jgi:hypothetical protein